MNNDTENQQLLDAPAVGLQPESTQTLATEPTVAPPIQTSLVELPVGVSMHANTVQIKAYGFDANQLRPLADVWTIPHVMQRPGLITVDTCPALVHLTRSFLVSLMAGGAKIARFAAVPKLKQAVVVLTKPGPAELALMFSHIAAAPDCLEVAVHQL